MTQVAREAYRAPRGTTVITQFNHSIEKSYPAAYPP